METEKFSRLFHHVPMEYRPIPFWSWNDRLDPDELRRQIRMMHKVGLGGFIMHARGGLETSYLEDDWMECVGACLEESRSLGMRPWLYDENGWPSGYANGRVPARDESFRGRWLVLESDSRIETVDDDSVVLGRYAVSDSGKYCRLGRGDAPSEGTRLRTVRVQETPYYVDVLNPDAIAAFIDETHKKYRSRFPGAFGSLVGSDEESLAPIAGFFTDEPRFSGSIDRDPPWSVILRKSFQERYGYDILDHLIALFLPVDGCEGIRYDYHRLCGKLFVTAYTEQLASWCSDAGVSLTGHLMMEESLYVQAANTAGVMPHYAKMDIPGVDWLRRPIGSPVVPRQVSSVAAQTGHKQVLTESFALAGWDVSFEELKRIVEWQYVNGVNLLCQHLQAYSLRGFRKRDYPPSLFYQQPWWDEYRIFNDYVSRLGMILAEGKHTARILVIHPMSSGWILYDASDYKDEFRRLDSRFVELCEALSGAHLEYHLGDETLIDKLGSVDGDGDVPRFIVGECSYNIVVLPEMSCLGSSTLNLLSSFKEAGGSIFSQGTALGFIDGRKSESIGAFLKTIQVAGDSGSLCRQIRQIHDGFIDILDEKGASISDIHCTERQFEESSVRFLVNLNQETGYQASLSVPGNRILHAYNAVDESQEPVPVRSDGWTTRFSLDFAAMQSYLIFDEPAGDVDLSFPEISDETETIDLSGEWTIDEMGPNALTLDTCSYRIDGGSLEETIPVIHLMKQLLEMRRSCDVEMLFTFESTMEPAEFSDLRIAVESLAEFKVLVNDNVVDTSSSAGWWLDRSFHTVDIRDYVQKGRNTISIERNFHQRSNVYEVLFGDGVYETEKNALTYDVELESIYLVGDFFVKSLSGYTFGERNSFHSNGPFRLIPKAAQVDSGNLVTQGLPFYSGKLTLSRNLKHQVGSGKRTYVSLESTRAVLAALSINDARVATISWASKVLDIDSYLQNDDNNISITLWSGNRNLLGPHHHIHGESYNVGPESFTGEWSWAEKATEAQPALPEETTQNYWKDGYSFVSFGIDVKQEYLMKDIDRLDDTGRD